MTERTCPKCGRTASELFMAHAGDTTWVCAGEDSGGRVVIGCPEPSRKFTVAEGLAWLGISQAQYDESCRILRGRHGNPIQSALLDARDAQGTTVTPEQVLGRHGINLQDPIDAVRRFDRARARYDT